VEGLSSCCEIASWHASPVRTIDFSVDVDEDSKDEDRQVRSWNAIVAREYCRQTDRRHEKWADEVLLQSLVASNKRSDEKKCDIVVTPYQR
jgi:hypothetical protein